MDMQQELREIGRRLVEGGNPTRPTGTLPKSYGFGEGRAHPPFDCAPYGRSALGDGSQ